MGISLPITMQLEILLMGLFEILLIPLHTFGNKMIIRKLQIFLFSTCYLYLAQSIERLFHHSDDRCVCI